MVSKTKTISSNTMTDKDLDKLFCMNAKKFKFSKLLLKSIAIVESSLDEHAYRYEKNFWDTYLKDNEEWKDKDPSKVSASWGLMQLMYTTAWELGFRGEPEELENPVYNIELGAKYLKSCLDNALSRIDWVKHDKHFSPLDAALAKYNGGRGKRPSENGVFSNQKYIDKVRRQWDLLLASEKDCDD